MLRSKGGRYMDLETPFAQAKLIRRGITPVWFIMFTMFNRSVKWQTLFNREAQPGDRQFAESWLDIAHELLKNDAIAPKRYEVRSGGLVSVIEGVDSVGKGKIVSAKLVHPCC